jgi:predicted kinase
MSGDFTDNRFDYSRGREGAGELVIMVGIPGSGKSTLVSEWVNRGKGKHVRFNRDDMRRMIYRDVPWSAHHDDLVRPLEMEMARIALKKGLVVYIDDTNTAPRTRNDWETLAQTTYSKLRIVTMTTPLATCVERDLLRQGNCKHCGEPIHTMEEQQRQGRCTKCSNPVEADAKCVGPMVVKDHHKKLTKLIMPSEPKSKVLTRAVFDRDALNTGGWTTRLPGAKWVLVDMDGTTASHTTKDGKQIRFPYDEKSVLLDEPREPVIAWVQGLYPHYNVCIVSGRHDFCGDDTCDWNDAHGLPFDHILMRRTGDNRPDFIVKREILDELVAVIGAENIAFILDDRPQVVRMWRGEGTDPHPYGRLTVYPVRGGTLHKAGCAYEHAEDYRTCPDCGALEDF